MAFQLDIVDGGNLFQTAAPLPTRNSVTWPELEERIDQHVSQVRMCGPLSAGRWMTLLGHSVARNELISPFRQANPRGISLNDLVSLCRQFEPNTKLVRYDRTSLSQVPTPCILIVNENQHCVVLESIAMDNQQVTLWDPSEQCQRSVALEAFQETWDGLAVTATPGSNWMLWLWRANRIAVLMTAISIVLLGIVRRRDHLRSRVSFTPTTASQVCKSCDAS